MKSSFCRTKCKSFLTPACTVMDKWYGWKVEEQEDKMLNLESAPVSRFQGDLVPEPEWQTLLVLAGVQEEYFKGYEDNWNTIFSVVDLAMGQQWRDMGHEQSGAARLGAKNIPPKSLPSLFKQSLSSTKSMEPRELEIKMDLLLTPYSAADGPHWGRKWHITLTDNFKGLGSRVASTF